MQNISPPCEGVSKILSKFERMHPSERMLHYCVEMPIPEGVLLFNLLTREMVLMTQEEWHNRFNNVYLKSHWFTVPKESNDKEYVDLIRWVWQNRKKRECAITNYTISPTTDCNARCYYCFQLASSRISMSEEVAYKVVRYIEEHCDGKKVKITWFGGEPLFNKRAIDLICEGLTQKNIEYTSLAISNGYLFDSETVEKAVRNWKLTWVQITLDGTESVYNKTKAYIYRQGNPYQVVMQNIDYLLQSGVAVVVRLNMDKQNADNLLELIEELARRFAGKKGLTVYAHHLFGAEGPMAELHSYEEWEALDNAINRLNKKIAERGMSSSRGIRKTPKTNHCMADSGESVTILPNGNIGLCDRFSESEFIGHIDSDSFDQAVVNSWKERIPEIPECATCFYYPDCMQLKKCASGSVCFEHLRREKRRKVERQMLTEYERWKSREEPSVDEEMEDC